MRTALRERTWETLPTVVYTCTVAVMKANMILCCIKKMIPNKGSDDSSFLCIYSTIPVTLLPVLDFPIQERWH